MVRDLEFMFGHLDDILVFSPNVETHLKHLHRLREADMNLKEITFNFLKAHIQNLEHLISGQAIEQMPEKLESVKDVPPYSNARDVKHFLGWWDIIIISFLILLIIQDLFPILQEKM